ncbi:MAG: hypothetical protein EAZ12_01875, partial [Sphingobacteriia bacterium]
MRFLLIQCCFLLITVATSAQKSAATVAKTDPRSTKSGESAAKTVSVASKPAPNKGHLIPITLTPLKNCTVYLGSHFGKSMTLVDSCKLNEKSMGVFKGDKKLTGGIYFVVSPNYTIQFELLMDDIQQFTISADTAQKEKFIITGSFDNDIFKQYSQYSTEKGRERQQLESEYKAKLSNPADSLRLRNTILQLDNDVDAYRNSITKKY